MCLYLLIRYRILVKRAGRRNVKVIQIKQNSIDPNFMWHVIKRLLKEEPFEVGHRFQLLVLEFADKEK
jgi:hypothetical protein